MNTHKNARLTYARRMELVEDVTKRGLSPSSAALAHGVSAPTARKWLGMRDMTGMTIYRKSAPR